MIQSSCHRWHKKADIANDSSKSQLSIALFRPGVIYPHVRITVDNLHSSRFYLWHNPAQKYRQIHINAFRSSFHRKCKTDLAVHVLNLLCSYPAQRITVIYREAHSLSLCVLVVPPPPRSVPSKPFF